MGEKITVSAKTLDEAITKALIELQTTSEHLHYEVVQKESSGLLGFFAKPCIIRAEVMSEEEEKAAAAAKRAEEKKAAEKKAAEKKAAEKNVPEKKAAEKWAPEKWAQEKAAPRKAESEPVKNDYQQMERPEEKIDGEKLEKIAREFLEQVFDAMKMQVSVEAVYDAKERELLVSMAGEDMGILIGKRGQTLDSLQYLVSLVVNKETEGYLRVKLDTENYRSRRKETLEILARNIAYKVKRTKHSVSLEPMNPYERRIIHSALQNDRYVVTRSEGEDPYRHVVISLKRESYGSGRRERYGSRRDRVNGFENDVERQAGNSVETAADDQE